MSEQKQRPVAIKLEGCEDVTLDNNTVGEGINFLDAKDSKNIKATRNKIHNDQAPKKKLWHEKLYGKILLGLGFVALGIIGKYTIG